MMTPISRLNAVAITLLVLANTAWAHHASPHWPDCFCTNRGDRVEIGDTACLTINGRSYSAVCYMSLNNPAWRKIEDGCTSLPIS